MNLDGIIGKQVEILAADEREEYQGLIGTVIDTVDTDEDVWYRVVFENHPVNYFSFHELKFLEVK